MTPDQLKAHFNVQTQTALAAILEKPVSTVAEWFQRGTVPRHVQLELQIRTGGKLKADQ
jgi:DNA-binding transcriptional regulator YiaG